MAAIYEAQRYGATLAVMLVHSFNAEHRWLDDFQRFASRLGAPVQGPDVISEIVRRESVALRIGWVSDRPAE